ncbi:AFG1-like ATPase-domain-containing protein [Schizophyllum fasciatum]
MTAALRLRQTHKCYTSASISRSNHPYSAQLCRKLHTEAVGLPAHVDLLDRYKGLVALGNIQEDEEQLRVVMKLRRLTKELEGYSPPAISAALLNRTEFPVEEDPSVAPWWKHSDKEGHISERAVATRKSHAEELAALTTPKGLLLIGTPGSGKSFLVDVWLDTLATPYKSRKHYSLIVLEIYRGVWEETQRRTLQRRQEADATILPPQEALWNKAIREHWRRITRAGTAPIRWASDSLGSLPLPWYSSTSESIAYAVARRLILRHWLLVLDELQLLDVSSATLLADVISWYWRMGGVIVGTSNRVPDDLYRNGVQRDRLEPFVEALKVRCPVVEMRSDTDWREIIARDGEAGRSWYTTEQQDGFTQAMKRDGLDQADSRHIIVFGRQVPALRARDDTAMFAFAELCHEALGPADYISIAANFHTIYITDIPVLRVSDKNQARRFISLIDALYESRCRLVALAEAIPQQLFFPDADAAEQPDVDVMMAESVAETRDAYRPNVSSYDAPKMQEAPEQAKTATPLDQLSIFSGQDEQFAFKRALSRLLEMTSPTYAHRRTWSPVEDRQWELTSKRNVPSPPVTATRGAMHTADKDDRLADKSLVHRPALRTTPSGGSRPPAPRIADRHIWGVESQHSQQSDSDPDEVEQVHKKP